MSIRVMSAVWDCDLDRSLKFVLLCYADYCNDDGLCWPSVAAICHRTGYDRRTVQRIRRKLEKAGYMSTTIKPNDAFPAGMTRVHVDALHIPATRGGRHNAAPGNGGAAFDTKGGGISSQRGRHGAAQSPINHKEPSGGKNAEGTKIRKFGPGASYKQPGYDDAIAEARLLGIKAEGMSVVAIKALIERARNNGPAVDTDS